MTHVPTMEAPEYRAVQMGNWTLDQWHATDKTGPIIVTGYYTQDFHMLRDIWRLRQGKTLWMSVSPMELESQAYHNNAAHGHVLVGGLGMGILAYNLQLNPKVDKVTVVERSPHVIELMYGATNISEWDKVMVVQDDVTRHEPESPVDTMLLDIWAVGGQEGMLDDIEAAQQLAQAELIGAWGLEWEFVTYLSEQGHHPPPTMEQWEEFQDEVLNPRFYGADVVQAYDEDYPELAVKAAMRQATEVVHVVML